MAKPSDFDIPLNAYFSESHEYVIWEEGEDRARIGISHFAAEQLGDVVYVEPPQIGDSVESGDTMGCIESVKAASDLYSPVSGEVMMINALLSEEPELINDNCYKDGWITEILLKDTGEISNLMTPEAYLKFLSETV
jgi:glycine cleavage system H protein